MLDSPRVLIKGGGDLASGVAHRLHQAGFLLLITELPQPLVVRRTVAFATAILLGETIVEGVRARRIDSAAHAPAAWARGEIAVGQASVIMRGTDQSVKVDFNGRQGSIPPIPLMPRDTSNNRRRNIRSAGDCR